MDRLLNVLADNLKVQIVAKTQEHGCLACSDDYENVSDEVKELFKDSFINHLSEKLQEIEAGTYVDYIFDHKYLKPYADNNKNMEEVLSKLPVLSSGKRYCFLPDTFFRIKKVSDTSETKLVSYSRWIAHNLSGL